MRKDLELAGAAEERRAILRKIRRIKAGGDNFDEDVLGLLESWILERDRRYQAKPGGLGRAK